MTRRTLALATCAALTATTLALVGCNPTPRANSETRADQLADSQRSYDERTPPQVTGDAEYQNYMRAQEDVYDDPASIIWCTVYPESPAAPIFTVPIAGKLTSSSVSYYPNYVQKFANGSDYGYSWAEEAQSVDGMYHGTPPAYRFGFTPGGQYVDFFNLPTFCTTALTEFQRQTLNVASVVAGAEQAQQLAEDALRAGDSAEAEKILDGFVE